MMLRPAHGCLIRRPCPPLEPFFIIFVIVLSVTRAGVSNGVG